MQCECANNNIGVSKNKFSRIILGKPVVKLRHASEFTSGESIAIASKSLSQHMSQFDGTTMTIHFCRSHPMPEFMAQFSLILI